MRERTVKPRPFSFGPHIPIVPLTAFDKLPVSDVEPLLDMAWQVCGPSAERNMNGRRPLALWQVIAAAYVEGLQHGAAWEREGMFTHAALKED